jgi:hypothetical protein
MFYENSFYLYLMISFTSAFSLILIRSFYRFFSEEMAKHIIKDSISKALVAPMIFFSLTILFRLSLFFLVKMGIM